jgi:hypothetical protein
MDVEAPPGATGLSVKHWINKDNDPDFRIIGDD